MLDLKRWEENRSPVGRDPRGFTVGGGKEQKIGKKKTPITPICIHLLMQAPPKRCSSVFVELP